jgi:hypothetical protein
MAPGACEWQIVNINGVDVSTHRASTCSLISQVLCRGLHHAAEHRAGPVLDDLSAIGPPAVWAGEGRGDREDVDR